MNDKQKVALSAEAALATFLAKYRDHVYGDDERKLQAALEVMRREAKP